MIKKLLVSILIPIWLLSACDFRPKRKIIHYQEEVKLSDGTMIWVDIKRHYRLVGEPFQGKGYLPSVIEISWDTGFKGVGRQTVFFDERVYLIDKIDDEWYVIGYRYPYEGSVKGVNAVNCRDVGALINKDYHCVFHLNSQGNMIKSPLQAQDFKDIQMNIFDTDYPNINPLLPDSLEGVRLSWSEKLDFQRQDFKDRGLVNKPYSYLIHKD